MLGDKVMFDVLQGSASVDDQFRELQGPNSMVIRIIRADYSRELGLICDCIEAARQYAVNSHQEKIISEYQDSFRSGYIEMYKQAQKSWAQDRKPAVETISGFVEPYRDPFGARAEFEGEVAVVDPEETKVLTSLVLESTKLIRHFPWAQGTHENSGKGPFERDLFEPPDFTSVHSGPIPSFYPDGVVITDC
jgi:dipeptidyl-peptidase III